MYPSSNVTTYKSVLLTLVVGATSITGLQIAAASSQEVKDKCNFTGYHKAEQLPSNILNINKSLPNSEKERLETILGQLENLDLQGATSGLTSLSQDNPHSSQYAKLAKLATKRLECELWYAYALSTDQSCR